MQMPRMQVLPPETSVPADADPPGLRGGRVNARMPLRVAQPP